MNRITILVTCCIGLVCCSQPENKTTAASKSNAPATRKTVAAADSARRQVRQINLPDGFTRTPAASTSFAAWLRTVGLKSSNVVHLYNGQRKANQSAQFAVLNIPVGTQDLQQCADAVMRLRAEYLFAQEQYSQIVFYDNTGGRYAFAPPYTRASLEKFLLRVFGMCGSASLEKQLSPVAQFTDIAPGDVLIRGGFPGHAEMVMDVATNAEGEKIYLLAQSYMPAQDIHILKNPADELDSPWYSASTPGNIIETPEYSFYKRQLRRW
jgi:hypothetical protein